ncbi:transposase [Actinoplanes utahensis]|uniref:transposase n=1 Tax=Actinoplanes utahensis TaxID=1869 RepID=UPI001269DB93
MVTGSDGRQSHRRGKGGSRTGPSPVNRGKPGSKHHLICDGNGTPIYVLTSGANVPDVKRALDLLDCYPADRRTTGPTPPALRDPAGRTRCPSEEELVKQRDLAE